MHNNRYQIHQVGYKFNVSFNVCESMSYQPSPSFWLFYFIFCLSLIYNVKLCARDEFHFWNSWFYLTSAFAQSYRISTGGRHFTQRFAIRFLPGSHFFQNFWLFTSSFLLLSFGDCVYVLCIAVHFGFFGIVCNKNVDWDDVESGIGWIISCCKK